MPSDLDPINHVPVFDIMIQMKLFNDAELYQYLKEQNTIPAEKLGEVYKEASENDVSFSKMLVERDLISDLNFTKAVAGLVHVPFVDLSGVEIDEETLRIIPEVYAKSQQVVAFKRDANGLHVALLDPLNKTAPEFIAKKSGMPVVVYMTTKTALDDVLVMYSKNVGQAFDEIIQQNVQQAKGSHSEPPVVKIVDTIIDYAYQNKASDVHIEPTDESSVVRFRIDGLLHDIVRLPVAIHPQIATRVKIMAKLRTDEHQAAQDGKLRVKNASEELDIRVSIVPVTKGEKVVMRLLSERSRQFSLQELGFGEVELKKIVDAYHKPHGMILATGPTGSGKTTTLYAIIKLLNRRDINIVTIEDPVEYEIEGISQIQVNPNTNLTFADGLRSVVRQDPDVILVGEIRDGETAKVSINAAMTGHLVFSSLHTNNAATTIPRLLDLGVEPYLVASSVSVIVAQRLVRKVCAKCRIEYEINLGQPGSEDENNSRTLLKKHLPGVSTIKLYKGKGCSLCHNTGYIGRIGIFEVLVVDEDIRQAIMDSKDAEQIESFARKNGMTTIVENGIQKVREGMTTMEEILRATMD